MDLEPSRETVLAAACCRWPQSPGGASAVRRAIAAGVDWRRFLHIVQRHRIEALVRAGLLHASARVPEYVETALAGRAARIAVANLKHAGEGARLFRAFSARGVDLIFVKGTTGAVLAYGSLAVKTAWDIDLLISRADAGPACELLAGLGYERIVPDIALSKAAFRRWVKHSKEMLWTNPATGIVIELHLDLIDNPQLLNGVGMFSPRQIAVHGEALALPTLATEELFAYMCVHGTIHCWARLKWLADVAALIETKGLDCEHLYRSSLALGAGRCGAVALLLCKRFFGTTLSERLTAELRSDRAILMLERSALAAIAQCENQADGTESAWQTLSLMATLFRVKPGWRYALAEIRYRLFSPYRPSYLAVWPWLWPLLTVLQFPRFALKRMRLRRIPGAPLSAERESAQAR